MLLQELLTSLDEKEKDELYKTWIRVIREYDEEDRPSDVQRILAFDRFFEELLSHAVCAHPDQVLLGIPGCGTDAEGHAVPAWDAVYCSIDEIRRFTVHQYYTAIDAQNAPDGEIVAQHTVIRNMIDSGELYLPETDHYLFSEWSDVLGIRVSKNNMDRVGKINYIIAILDGMSFFGRAGKEDRKKAFAPAPRTAAGELSPKRAVSDCLEGEKSGCSMPQRRECLARIQVLIETFRQVGPEFKTQTI